MTPETRSASSVETARPVILPADTPRVSDILMRTLDVVVAAVLLILLAPLLLIVALLVKRDSPGPALFRQRRLGKDLQSFRVCKFRTMDDGASPEAHKAYVERMIREDEADESGVPKPMLKLQRDPRITKIGAFLRKTSIDELPQLWNVLVGEMSLVGPRPPIQYEVDAYPARAFRRFAVRPGVTGLWQVSGRSLITFAEMIELDTEYVERRSLLLNVKIILLTIPTVLGAKGAE
ncbi:MAG TPA: sugar transferase [Solirubrobacterales bacterium]|nr:sugar transferase [Solirubrobacterales bacterium]